jgi:hypothetical protein
VLQQAGHDEIERIKIIERDELGIRTVAVDAFGEEGSPSGTEHGAHESVALPVLPAGERVLVRIDHRGAC